MLRLIDPSLCVHHKTSFLKVQKYELGVERGDLFPPIEVLEFEGKYYVADGAHRTEAHKNKQALILAFVYDQEDFPKRFLLGSRNPKGSF